MRYTEFDWYHLFLLIRAGLVCMALAVAAWLFMPCRPFGPLLALGWVLWVWQRVAPLQLQEVRITPHAFHVHLQAVAAGHDLRESVYGYFVRPNGRLPRALAGSVFLYVGTLGTVAICGPRYMIYRPLRRGLVGALASTTCPHATCAECKSVSGASRLTARPPHTFVTGELDLSTVVGVDR